MFHPFTIRFHLVVTMFVNTDASYQVFEGRPVGDL
jgi:hypothetical protein